jgi:hypothetical protein
MTTTVTDQPNATHLQGRAAQLAASRVTLSTLAVTGGVLLVLGASLGLVMLLDPRPYSELAGTWMHLVHYAVWTVCLVALSQLLPRLGGLSGERGRAVSSLAATMAGVGVALDACARFALAFYNPMLAAHEPALLDTPPDAVLLVPSLAVGVVAMVGLVWLGVSGWRARAFPRTAVVVLVVGAVAIPAIGPVSNVLVGAALAWIAIASLRRS